jgi:signal transduction histidine kinase
MSRLSRVARAAVRGLRDLDARTRGGAPATADWLLTVGWLLVMAATTSVRTGTFQVPSGALAVGVVGAWAPLLLRTWRPLLALTGTLVAESLVLVFLAAPQAQVEASGGMGAYQPVPLATMLAVATVAVRVPVRVGWVVGAVAGVELMAIAVTLQSAETLVTDLVMFYLVVTAAAVGVWRSARREQARRAVRERDAHVQGAVLDERLRIARELHDVLAHNLTLVNAQAGVARYLLHTDTAAAEQALRGITEHTGRAIDELRATIGLMRRGGEEDAEPEPGHLRPVPGIDDVAELAATFRAAGTRVDVTVDGTPRALAQQVDLAAYRIVQEAITNAAKHAPGTAVEVRLTWTDAGVRLRVRNPLAADPGRAPAPGTGNGLIGMRERSAAAGGALRVGTTADGGFEVVATLPADPGPHDLPARPGADQPIDPSGERR